ncbi:MAG: 50S ribosomal protein L10 [Spirochaetes bacterium GWF1_51_8]|nr:MAG: 50S ribosomal protein L10 [Spirochaetes bacterium GWF1_51_8]
MIKVEKTNVIEKFAATLKDTDGFIVANFKGMTVTEMEDLRAKVRELGGGSHVVKNRLLKLALDKNGIKGMEPYLKQNTLLIYSKTDVLNCLKAIIAYAKKNEKCAIKGGLVSNTAYDNKQVIEISKLPGKKELIAIIAGTMTAVVGQFAGVLNSLITTFMGTVEALEKKKS